MDLIKLAIRQPVTVIVGVLLLLLAGLVSLSRLPIQLTPNVDSTIITVSTFWEGASPEEIEQNVIDKQEERLLGLSNLVEMTSESSQSLGRIRLEFTTGTDIKAARQEVSDKLREVPEYPDNVDEPVIAESDEETRDYIAWIVFWTTDPDFDIEVTRDFAVDRIEPALENVPGISEIQVYGGREREVQIRVDPVALAQYGITPTQFANVIRDTNRYFRQQIRDDGWQENIVESINREAAPISKVMDKDGRQRIVKVPLTDPPIHVAVWKVAVGRVSLYLMDTDVEINDPWNRGITARLYIGDLEQRLRQEIVLGLGGAAVLKELGIDHYLLHLNEGHAAFALLERIRATVSTGKDFATACEKNIKATIFTTHTPFRGSRCLSLSVDRKVFSFLLAWPGSRSRRVFPTGHPS
jgi:hypothetical protein